MAADRPNEGSEPARRPRTGRRTARLKHLAVILAIVALAFAATNVWRAAHPPAVAAEFTRVGGANRVETAADAATFWLTPPRQYYMCHRQPTPPPSCARPIARCSTTTQMLFVPLEGKAPLADREPTTNWMSTPLPTDEATPVWVRLPQSSCPRGSIPNRMHTWVNNEQALPGGAGVGPAVRVQFAIHQETDSSHSWCSPRASAPALSVHEFRRRGEQNARPPRRGGGSRARCTHRPRVEGP